MIVVIFTIFSISVRRLPFGDRVFIYHFERMSYSEALTQCTAIQATLLVVDSAAIQAGVINHLTQVIGLLPQDTWENTFAPGYWLGGRDFIQEGQWFWIDGSRIPTLPGEFGYQNWYRQGGFIEPANGLPADDCLFLSGLQTAGPNFPDITGGWFDSDCNVLKYFICEQAATSTGTINFL